jgi:acyl-CoA thioesterase-2
VAPDHDNQAAIRESLDLLLRALDLRSVGDDRFATPSEAAALFDRVYGGQLLAEAVAGAAATVEGKEIASLHATFVRAGTPGRERTVVVERVRDGRSMATRHVEVRDGERTLLVALASFHHNGVGPDLAIGALVPAADPQDVPTLQHWAEPHGRHWIDHPPPVELRMAEAPSFIGGPRGDAPRVHWMRLPHEVGDDPGLHAALLAYASDFFLMDMVFRSHPDALGPGTANGTSLDHAIWFHRPVRFDRWHRHTEEAIAVVGDRGLARGAIHDADGHLVASVMQEVLVLPAMPVAEGAS